MSVCLLFTLFSSIPPLYLLHSGVWRKLGWRWQESFWTFPKTRMPKLHVTSEVTSEWLIYLLKPCRMFLFKSNLNRLILEIKNSITFWSVLLRNKPFLTRDPSDWHPNLASYSAFMEGTIIMNLSLGTNFALVTLFRTRQVAGGVVAATRFVAT